MTRQLDDEYLEWLKAQVYDGSSSKTYDELLSLLHDKEFVWIIPNDDNRLEDGLDVRNEFLDVREVHPLLHKGVSVLEVLVGLSRRMAFAAGREPRYWAWQLLGNLGLHRMSDPVGIIKTTTIDEILETLIWRNYEPDGRGGFFPLRHPREDQTKVELWYQMNAYINEIFEP